MEVVERAVRVIRPLLEQYSEERERVVRKYKDDDERYDEMLDALQELDAKYALATEKKLKEKGISAEVVWEWIDESERFSGMGFSHKRVELHVCTVVSYPSAWYVTAVFEEREVFGEYEFEYLYCAATCAPIVDEKTPFALRLSEKVPWTMIREIWRPHVENIIAEIARAERRGELKETLQKVEKEVKQALWIYDFQHFCNALNEVKREFNL